MGVRARFHRGAWWVFIDHHGRRKAKKVGDRTAAETLAKMLRERLARADLHLPSSDDQTFRTYTDAWLKISAANLKASTVWFYQRHLELHILPMLGHRPVMTLRRADCRDLVTTCRGKGLKVSTVRGIARTLSTILSQAVEDELLPANPALRLGRYLRSADDPEPEIDPFTREDVAALLVVARQKLPEWYAWLLCGLRTGMRAGELLALQWGDVNWRGSCLEVRRNLVRGQLTTPKNHQRRRVDLSRQLRSELRLWRKRQRAAWLKFGQPFPEWVFPSVTGTALDESNVRKAFNRILDAADLHRRGPHQMRHTFASLLLRDGAPITYVAQQLGHRDASITLRVYAHWLPNLSDVRAVDLLDDTQPSATQAQPTTKSLEWKSGVTPYAAMVRRGGIEPPTRRLRVASSRSKNRND